MPRREIIDGINPLHNEPVYIMVGKGAGVSKIVQRQSRKPIANGEPLFLLRAKDPAAIAALRAYAEATTDPTLRDAAKQQIQYFQGFRREFKEYCQTQD